MAISNGNNTIAGVRLAASVAFQVSSDHDRSDRIVSTVQQMLDLLIQLD
jgi:hypothetical protein